MITHKITAESHSRRGGEWKISLTFSLILGEKLMQTRTHKLKTNVRFMINLLQKSGWKTCQRLFQARTPN